MYSTIYVALDNSEYSVAATTVALDLAEAELPAWDELGEDVSEARATIARTLQDSGLIAVTR